MSIQLRPGGTTFIVGGRALQANQLKSVKIMRAFPLRTLEPLSICYRSRCAQGNIHNTFSIDIQALWFCVKKFYTDAICLVGIQKDQARFLRVVWRHVQFIIVACYNDGMKRGDSFLASVEKISQAPTFPYWLGLLQNLFSGFCEKIRQIRQNFFYQGIPSS